MSKQYTTVKSLVNADLEKRTLENIETISQYTIDSYFQEIVRTKAHLCKTPLKFSTVNRYVERYLKTIKG